VTQEQKVIRAKVGVLELAKQLGYVSPACKMMAIPGQYGDQAASRQPFGA
jgi:hypothetical protein